MRIAPAALVLAVAAIFTACGRTSIEERPYAYRDAAPSDSAGTGRLYFGREIARVTTHRGGAEWLERPTRENTELPDRLVANMDLRPSDVVADIGAGTGYFTFRIAERVPTGRVLAVDIQQEMLDDIAARRDSLGVRNVETVLGTERSPNLATESIDVALMVAAYHEFFYPWEMMTSIYDALRPGGRVVLIDYRAEDETLEVNRLHRLSEQQATRELEAAGFDYRFSRDILPQQHFIVFEKPFGAG